MLPNSLLPFVPVLHMEVAFELKNGPQGQEDFLYLVAGDKNDNDSIC